MTETERQLNNENGYTIVVYMPPQASSTEVEAVFNAVADVVHDTTKNRGYWDPFVVGYAGDMMGIDNDPEGWPTRVANPKRTRVA